MRVNLGVNKGGVGFFGVFIIFSLTGLSIGVDRVYGGLGLYDLWIGLRLILGRFGLCIYHWVWINMDQAL